jgi:hypothetical protein
LQRRSLLLWLRNLLPLIDNLGRRAELLVVRVLHGVAAVYDLGHVAEASAEVQNALALGISREPAVAVHLLPPDRAQAGPRRRSLAQVSVLLKGSELASGTFEACANVNQPVTAG